MANLHPGPILIGLKEQVLNSSVVVKTILILLVLFYLLSFAGNGVFLALSLTPGLLIPPNFRIWTYITFAFIENHLWNLVASMSVVVVSGILLEPLWGALELLVFITIVNVFSGVATVAVYLFFYMLTSNTYYLWEVHICGLTAFVAAVAVALKQTMGDQELLVIPITRLRAKHLPMLLTLFSLLLSTLGIFPLSNTVLTLAGLTISWIYLRFYQKQREGSRGDMSETFTFASFFPDPLQPPIAIVANTIHSILVRLKICKKQVRRYDVGAPSAITISLPGTDPQDAERRRQLAIRALNERLSQVDQTSWPNMEDGSSSPTEENPHSPIGRDLQKESRAGDSVIVQLEETGDKESATTSQ